MSRSVLFLVVFLLFVVALLVLVAVSYLSARRRAAQDWHQLFGRLVLVDRYKVERVALSLLEPESPLASEEDLAPEEIWDLLGGLEGLEILRRNCSVLVELACFVQVTYPEALVVAEQLRLNAREIQWHVDRLCASSRVESLHASFPHYAQRVAATYYGMTQTLLGLSRVAGSPMYAELQAAL